MTIPLASLLLVDDDPDVLLTLGMVLESAGYTVITAVDAAQALRLAAQTDFHVALVDYRLSGSSMNGLELVVRLREASPLTVCLLMTAHDRGEVGFRAAQAGAFAYLTKPFSHEALLGAVRAALDERLRREGMRDRLQVGDLVMEGVIHKALSRLRKRIGKDRILCLRGRGYLLR